MAAETDLYNALSGSSNITTLVSTRIYSDLRDQGAELPAIYFEKTGVDFSYTLDSYTPATTTTDFIIRCFETTRLKSETLADHVITALASNNFMCADDQSDYDEETQIYTTTIQASYLEV